MKILHIMAGRGLGGAETYSTDIMLSLHAKGVAQVCVLAPDAPRVPELLAAGVPLALDPLALRFGPLQRWRIKRLIEREQPDLIHCWMRRAASFVPDWREGPVIGWFGGYYDPRKFGKCSVFVGVTQDIVRHMVAKGVAPEKAHYVPTFPDVREERAVDRASLQTPADAFVLLALSRLHEKKGLDVLLRAAKNIPNAYVWLAGEGPLRDSLERLTRALGMEERVRFLGWRTDRGALLRAADVCVLPSRYEPFGTVILEAWAAQTPFVAAASAGPAAHVRDGENGLLVPIDDAKELTSALVRLRDNQDLRRSVTEGGFLDYTRNFTKDVVTARMGALYETLIAAHKKTM